MWYGKLKYGCTAKNTMHRLKATPINIATERYKSVHKYEITCMLKFLQNQGLISERHDLVKYRGRSCS